MSDRKVIYSRLLCAILVCASTWFAAETVEASSRQPDQVYLVRYSLGPLLGRSTRYLVFRAKLNAAGDKKQPERPTVGSFKGAGYWLDGCPTEKDRRDYICFLSDYFSFTYPKNRKADQLGWSVGDGQYKILQQDVSVRRLGVKLDNLLRIAISPDATKTGRLLGRGYEVLYSPEAGVVAITMKHSDKAGLVIPTFWLVGETGLGAKLDHVVGTPLTDQWGGQEPE